MSILGEGTRYGNHRMVTLDSAYFKQIDEANPGLSPTPSGPTDFSIAIGKNWALMQGSLRAGAEKRMLVKWDLTQLSEALDRKNVYFDVTTGNAKLTYEPETISNTTRTSLIELQVADKAFDMSTVSWNTKPTFTTVNQKFISTLLPANEVSVYPGVWCELQTTEFVATQSLKNAIQNGLAFAIGATDPAPQDSSATTFGALVYMDLGAVKLTIDVKDIQLGFSSLQPVAGAYVAPNQAAVLSWEIDTPSAYFSVCPQQASFEAQYYTRKGGVTSSVKTLTGTTAKTATVPASDMAGVEALAWRVRVTSDDGIVGAWSDWRTCTCVNQTGKATALSPDGASVSQGETVAFLWEHSSAAGRAQAGVQLQMKPSGDENWTDIYTASTTERRADVPLPAELTQTAGQAAWRVRTRDDLGGWSEWSDALYIYVVSASAAPTVAVYSSDTMRPRVEWQSAGQTGYRVKIRRQDGTLCYDSGVLAGSGQSHTVAKYLPDGSYTAAVSVWNEYAIESAEGTQTFTISAQAAKPNAVTLSTGQSTQGCVRFTLSQAPGGRTVLLRDGVSVPFVQESDTTILDCGASTGTHSYVLRVETDAAYTDSESVTAQTILEGASLALTDAPEDMIFLRLNRDSAPSHADDLAMEAVQRGFSGRTLPVVEFSGRLDHIHRHTFALPGREELQQLLDMLLKQKPLLYRDQFGRRYSCVCASLPVSYDAFSECFTLELTEIDDGIAAPIVKEEAQPPGTDTSDATLLAADAPYGKIFYGASGRAVGQVPDNRVKPRGWSKLPIRSIRTRVGAHYFQRVSDDLLTVFVPGGFSDTPPLFFKMHSKGLIGAVAITVGGTDYTIAAGTQQMVTVSFSEGADTPISVAWQDAAGTHTKALRLRMVKSSDSRGVLTVVSATADGSGGSAQIVSRMCENAGYVNGISLSGDTAQVVLTCAGTPAYAVYRGCRYGADASKQITIPAVNFAEGFAQIDMIDPKTGFRMPYFLSRQLEDGTIIEPVLARPDCALAFLDEKPQFYDYNANGYGPPTAEMEALRDSAKTLDTMLHGGIFYEEGPWQPTGSENFAQRSVGTASVLFDLVNGWLSENACKADTDDNSDVTALFSTGKTPVGAGSLGAGSRWLVFVNGRAVTAPGFLANVQVNPNLRLELVYTCADGIDVGFPYAGV